MKKLFFVMSLVFCVPTFLCCMELGFISQQSFALIGKDQAKIFLPSYVARTITYFNDQIDDVEDHKKPFQFFLELPHASLKDLKHIESYVTLRADMCSTFQNTQMKIFNYVDALSQNEVTDLIKHIRALFYTESVPKYLTLFLLSQTSDRYTINDTY